MDQERVMKFLEKYWGAVPCILIISSILYGYPKYLGFIPCLLMFIILCVFVVLWFLFAKEVGNIRKPIEELNKKINDEIEKRNLNYQDFKKSELSFWINNQVELDNQMKPFFKPFFDSCIQDKETKELFATHKIEGYVNATSLIRINKIYEEGPSILTGLGLLFTFGAIAWSLTKLNLSSSDVTAIQMGIGHLISGLTAKFLSSIAGIITALTYVVIRTNLIHKTEKEIHKFCGLINKTFKFKYPEQILFELKENAIEQTESLKDYFSNDFTYAIQKILDNSNEAKIIPVLNEIKDHLATSDGSKMLEAMQIFIDRISEKMNEVNSQQSEGLVSSIQEVQNESRKFIDEITKLMLNKSFEVNQQIITQQNEIVSQQEIRQKTFEQNISSVLAEMSNSSDTILTQINDKILSITELLTYTQSQALETQNKNNLQNQEFVTQITNNLAGVSNEILGSFEENIKSNIATTNQLNSLIQDVIEKYNQTVAASQITLEKTQASIDAISQASQEFRLITSNISNASSSITYASKSLEMVNTSIIEHASLVTNGYGTLKDSLELQMQDWNKHIDGVKSTEQQLLAMVNTLNSVIENYVTKFDARSIKFLKDFSDRFIEITNATKNAVESIEEFAESCSTNNLKNV